MEKLFLLDAYALIYRAYYGFIKNPRINSKGQNTSAILGFVNTLEEVIRKEKPDYIGVIFDPHGPTFRHELYPAYKAQREETPEGIKFAVPIIKKILEAYNIQVIEMSGYEADDVIGTLSTKFSDKENIITYMMTPDKDYGQLVRNNVVMYKPRHDGGFDVLGEKEIKEKYDIDDTKQVMEILALMGDTADNFPGCPGVGEKTAQKLVKEYGNTENIISHASELKGALRKKVEEHIEDIKISKILAEIKTNVPIDIELESLRMKEANEEEIIKIFEELEFKTLINKKNNNSKNTSEKKSSESKKSKMNDLFNNDFFSENQDEDKETEKINTLETIKTNTHKYYLIDSESGIDELVARILTSKFISLDTETTNIEPTRAELVGLSFSINENEAYYVACPDDKEKTQEIINKLKVVYENPEIQKIGQNIKYDIIVLAGYGVTLKGEIFDTMIAHYLISPELRHNMDYLAEIYLNYKTIHIDELIGSGKKQKNMRDLTPEEVYEYAAEDADITLRLWNKLKTQLEEKGLVSLFKEIEMPLVPVLAKMEINGATIDKESLSETSKLFTRKMNDIEEKIKEIAGEEINISSPKQIGELLFDKLKLSDKAKKTKTGQYVTSEEVLNSLKGKHEIIELILEYRGYKKLLSTYIDALPELINPKTGRIHTSYNQAVTTTGRLSSSNPNLQNIPIRDENGKEVRKAFIPENGCLFFSCDYSQIELRIMAHLSQDKNMIEDFNSGHDIHKATAAKIYKTNINDVTSDMRRKAKTANFGIIYGISAFGLAERIGITRQEAKQLIDEYFNVYPGVKEYMEKSIFMAREEGYTETMYGRRCQLPDINSRNAVVRGYAERNAINSPIQGSAADIIKIAMSRIYHKMEEMGVKSKMILQVHDELNFSVIPEEKEIIEKLVKEEMENTVKLSVPLIAEGGWGKNWLEAH
mgnify:CR=1 FL=1